MVKEIGSPMPKDSPSLWKAAGKAMVSHAEIFWGSPV